MKLMDVRTSTSKGKKLMAIFCKCHRLHKMQTRREKSSSFRRDRL